MPLDTEKYTLFVKDAVSRYWETLKKQSSKQKSGTDNGRRSSVTGGKQMDGFCDLIKQVLIDSGLSNAEIHLNKKLELPGYFRATKSWDMLVVSNGSLVAAIEFKSQVGPSFGNNLNNRAEELIGTAKDLWIAYREGAFGNNALRPWLGCIVLLEDCPNSTKAVRSKEPHFKVFPEFKQASYAKRWEILLKKLLKERLYDSVAFMMSTEDAGRHGDFSEPAKDISIKVFLAGLAGQIGVHLANGKP